MTTQPDPSQVICPGCVHQFRAVPEDVQAGIRAARNELGVPTADYPAPIANAAEILWRILP